ncbi:type I restriction endonuclease subunit R [Streptomyces guryensis]|uniref:type I site-specific deoxyribonuclease n=1 Tax=Streptomyces guryensis TaxID=2886947 RepID=A0A9Q3ZBP8_9ACTN|nr:type I restriction endonuclease [Streptomyces guryensis]MCD9880559.1 DEAD/DEAH box helicase family protein [Streptomyces guryensis]
MAVRGGARSEIERDEVETPFIRQLESLGWTHVTGKDLADGKERDYTDVLLKNRLTKAIRRVNRLHDSNAEWIDTEDQDGHATRAIATLESVSIGPQGRNLHDANFQATDLLLHGAPPMRGHAVHHKGHDVIVQYIDWEIENEEQIKERNDFLVVSQLRVRTPAGYEEIPDLVLFVNGIPVAVVECKSPDLQDPVGLAIRDLRAYTGNPVECDADERDPRERPRGIPALFKTVQLLIAAAGTTAQLGTITSRLRDFAPWRSVEPDYKNTDELRDALRQVDVTPKLLEAGEEPTEQQQLVAAVLKPVNLLNILRHYVFAMPLKEKKRQPGKSGGRKQTADASHGAPKTKAVCRHQQYRAVEKIVHRLRNRRTRLDPGATEDERGGVIWHTQGSGKSLTMAFLARRLHMSRDEALNTYTLLVVTDRTQLQDQLDAAIRRGGRSIKTAERQADIEGMLRVGGRHVVFAMIQKFGVAGFTSTGGGGDDRSLADEYKAVRQRIAAGVESAEATDPVPDTEPLRFPRCTESTKVLVLIDEAHRSHTSMLHTCLRQAAPNAARIGFTGTPIMEGKLRDTERIFGPFIDKYMMAEAEHDKVVVPIRYEGRTGPADVRQGEDLDAKFENLIADRTEEQRKVLRKKYSQLTERDVAESVTMIRAKADDMLRHYVAHVLSGGFKAQVAVVSRRATVEYRHALRDVRAELLEEVAEFAPQGRLPERLRGAEPRDFAEKDRVLYWAWRFQEIIRRMEFVPVISAGGERKNGLWREWTEENQQKQHIERFLEDLPQLPRDNPWGVTYTPQPILPRMGMIAKQPWSAPAPVQTSSIPEEAPVTFLIVKSMLLTGFDAPGEQVLYLDRPIRDAELLQAIARVNRPASGKEGGTVVDYYGVLAPLSDALSGYGKEAPAVRASLRDVESAVADTGEAAKKVQAFLADKNISGNDLDTRGGRARAMLALCHEDDRALFDKELGEFLGTLERVLPHEDALGFLRDAKRWALLQQRVRRHYRDAPGGLFSLRGYGRKVRALIAEHLEAPEIIQVIPPVSILSEAFDDAVQSIEDPREAAAEMEHALRYHLEERVRREDEAKYKQLSKALKEVLENMDARWQIDQLAGLITQVRQEQDDDPLLSGATLMERRLHGWLKSGIDSRTAIRPPEPAKLRALSASVYEVVREQVRSVGYRAQGKHVTRLTAHVTERLRADGLEAESGGTDEVRAVARHIVNHVQEHVQEFREER